MRKVVTLGTFLYLAAAAAGRAPGNFEFDSGGAHHPAGYGAWRVVVNTAGTFSVTHDVAGTVYDCGSFTLSRAENDELWRLVADANIARLPAASRRPGNPDEPLYRFTLAEGENVLRVEAWRDDVARDKKVQALLEYLTELIKKYAGTRPVLR